MLRRAGFFGALIALIGCASPTHNAPLKDGGTSTSHDLAGHSDGHIADLAQPLHDAAGIIEDLATGAIDASVSPDLVVAPLPDLAQAPADMAQGMMCIPQTQPCDVLCQNCGVNLKCDSNNNGQPVCIASGNVPTGSPCGKQGVDDCVNGDVCVEETMSLNQCVEFCRVDGDCKNGGKCAYTLNGGALKVCSDKVTNCDPVKMTGCNQGACYVVTPDGQTGCHQTGGGQQCDPCVSDYDCSPGYACFGNSNFCGGPGCVPLCHQGNQLDCFGFFLNCVDVNGWNSWGICDF